MTSGAAARQPTVLLVCPTMWDDAELPAAALRGGYEVIPYGTDVSEHPERFDALAFIEQVVAEFRGRELAGVMASDDYPGSIVAAAIARALGLPGPAPETILLCQHKYYARQAQQGAVPEAVPHFTLVDPHRLPETAGALSFPVFVKPVKSFFSVLAGEVHGADELAAVVREAAPHLRDFVKPFNQLLRRYTSLALDGGYLLAEQPLRGVQVTVEGFVFHGEVGIIGVTDSIMYPGTISFERFEYPSALPASVQERMAAVATRVVRAVGFDDGLFNIEMFHDPATDAVSIIEMNPRMCPQFADLVEKVHGVSSYDIALSIAAGERPPWPSPAAGAYPVAASFAMRQFTDAVVERVPDAGDVARLLGRFPDARLKILCRPGHALSEELQDGKSYRYAVLNLGGTSRSDLLARYEEAMRSLPFDFTPVA